MEGPDGAGKSTLVRKLRERFNLSEGQRGTSDRKLLYTVTVPDTMRALTAAVDGRQSAQIWDRLYYSELVYADLVGRPIEFNATQRSFIQRMIEAIRCPVILCLPPFSVVQTNALKDEQMDGVNENLEHIYGAYLEMFSHGTLPEHTMLYDYTNGAPERVELHEVVGEIKDYLDERSERSWVLTPR